MAKRLIFMLSFMCGALLFGIAANAGMYTDDMASAASDSVKTYYNLKPATGSDAWRSRLPDSDFLVFENPLLPVAKAVYTVRSAKELTVSVYTQTGSFVSRASPDNTYVLGFYQQGDVFTSRPQDSERAQYSPSRAAVYTRSGSNLYSLAYRDYYKFVASSESDPGDLTDYAVNAYYSTDGQSYIKMSLVPGAVRFSSETGYCYEQFTCAVPPGAQSIMVEINDFLRYYDESDQKIQSKVTRLMTSLASASITGDDLAFGPAEGPSEASIPQTNLYAAPNSAASSRNPTASSKAGSKASSSPKQSSAASSQKAPAGSAASDNPGSSKFEGVISSSKSSSPSRSSPPSRPQSQQESGSRAAQSPLADPQVPAAGNAVLLTGEPVIYDIPAKGGKTDLFSWAIGAYIAIVAGAILFFVLRPKK